MKREREEFIFEKFKNSYKHFPLGKIDKEHKDMPDFMLYSEGKKIGIEVTEVYQDSNDKYSRLKQKFSDRQCFTELLIQELQELVNFKFELSILFNEHEYIKKSERSNISEILCELVREEFIKLENKNEIVCKDQMMLPEQIVSIQILRFDELDESFYNNSEGGSIGALKDPHIESILLKKEKALLKYIDCDEQWLLISQGNGFAGYFVGTDIKPSFESNFDKVFLFKLGESKIIELK
ncbi:conserved protein of unknown function [Tenacibaculum sp. 190130A14a]|uniref:SH3 domain-containing protein n=1 Tax=Tenacibaculum polynesiense TaxID=3137857 RepID=A0ABP1F7T9_9FLAO